MPSITFAGVNLATYGLVLVTPDPSMQLASQAYQMLTRAYAPESKHTPKNITLGVEVVGTSRATAEAYLDSIKAVLNRKTDGRLLLSNVSDRYWMARYQSLVGSWPAPSTFSGTLSFVAHDPMAYAVTETVETDDVDADPKEISLTVAGSGDAEPVIVLTAGEAWDSTLTLLNAVTGQEFTWSGAMTSGQRLTIDSGRWYVSLEGASAMTGAGGEFLVLVPGSNLISITGFGSLGSVKIRYRARYA
jgi:predicted phage tail component-like protein